MKSSFRQRDGQPRHVRKTTLAEPKLKNLYAGLGLCAISLGVKKLVS